ncbi:nuclear transport factor 2 family protein [Pontibacter sp. G13]|uniref:nuclear transport factor 2 family protein n=1 Tax=Pontibacter sp. G13 TaxID=3074898 RepID=UPI00288A71F0|nr:nuclear transport factor 2 family protein [Pontibacter sp. G13]WNJ18297.1 nuclear transport factor 2 family protein [Pontibacter sp. G13]
MNQPQDAVLSLFKATDQRNWPQVEAQFSQSVVLDYASMNGNPATTLSPQEIAGAWKNVLPGFEHTHHQIGNLQTEVKGRTASVFCYGTASHYLPHDQGNVWWVVGTYDFDLEQAPDGVWRITTMRFNYQFQDGNEALPEAAMRKVNQQGAR